MAPSEPVIGAALTAAELPDAEALVREAGWNQVAADWEIFRALGTVFAARTGNRVVATAAILPYGQFAWISMVLVAGEQRRRNLGTQLLKRCVDALREQGRVPVLDATPAGRPLYRALGFEETWGYHRLARGNATPLPEHSGTGWRHDRSPDRRRGLARIVRLRCRMLRRRPQRIVAAAARAAASSRTDRGAARPLGWSSSRPQRANGISNRPAGCGGR